MRFDRGNGATRRRVLGGLAASLALGAGPARAQSVPPEGIDLALRAFFGSGRAIPAAIPVIAAYQDQDIIPSLILARRYTPEQGAYLDAQLQRLTGEADRQGWFDWMLWQEAHPEVRPRPSYIDLKRDLFQAIDPNFSVFLEGDRIHPDKMRIRLEEIAWGGVDKDGIPSLDNPTLIPAADAGYLRDDDLVFGVAIDGDARAYPLRIMGWHEMFNDVVGGVPLALAYCTLCGAGILFETQVDGRERPFVFGSSGFLYRSNKLMFDRETHSLWNQFTGEPVAGPLVESGIALKQRPVVVAPWSEWRARNPSTRALSLKTGHRRDYGSGVVYRDYFASDDLMFPAAVDQTRLSQKDYVFGVRRFAAAKAWPLPAFEGGRVINDQVGDLPLVLIGDAAGRTVRAYERGARIFEAAAGGALTADGDRWTIGEEALTGPKGETAPRVAGHVAYWFAWDGYLAGAELFQE